MHLSSTFYELTNKNKNVIIESDIRKEQGNACNRYSTN